eukprot:10379557-Alexandrium_andersonii.AAC.1
MLGAACPSTIGGTSAWRDEHTSKWCSSVQFARRVGVASAGYPVIERVCFHCPQTRCRLDWSSQSGSWHNWTEATTVRNLSFHSPFYGPSARFRINA